MPSSIAVQSSLPSSHAARRALRGLENTTPSLFSPSKLKVHTLSGQVAPLSGAAGAGGAGAAGADAAAGAARLSDSTRGVRCGNLTRRRGHELLFTPGQAIITLTVDSLALTARWTPRPVEYAPSSSPLWRHLGRRAPADALAACRRTSVRRERAMKVRSAARAKSAGERGC